MTIKSSCYNRGSMFYIRYKNTWRKILKYFYTWSSQLHHPYILYMTTQSWFYYGCCCSSEQCGLWASSIIFLWISFTLIVIHTKAIISIGQITDSHTKREETSTTGKIPTMRIIVLRFSWWSYICWTTIFRGIHSVCAGQG